MAVIVYIIVTDKSTTGLPGIIWDKNETCKLHISWKSP